MYIVSTVIFSFVLIEMPKHKLTVTELPKFWNLKNRVLQRYNKKFSFISFSHNHEKMSVTAILFHHTLTSNNTYSSGKWFWVKKVKKIKIIEIHVCMSLIEHTKTHQTRYFATFLLPNHFTFVVRSFY